MLTHNELGYWRWAASCHCQRYFYFVTRFFEPINVSATHIYHSALELSPMESIVRKLYYCPHSTPFPKVALGMLSSWDQSIATLRTDYPFESIAWSPCGQVVVAQTRETVEIWDPLTLELLSTLKPTRPTSWLIGMLAYSPDVCSLACGSNAGIIIWDIQTGGVVKELQHDVSPIESLVWSLDGGLISTMAFDSTTNTSTLFRYNVISGTTLSPIQFQSEDRPHLWAHSTSFHSKSFWVRVTTRDGRAYTIDILEIGSALTGI